MASSAAVSHSPFSSHETATALVLGSTGAVGRHLLAYLLTSSNYSHVVEVGRRATAYPVKGVVHPPAADLVRLRNVIVDGPDFEDCSLLAGKLKASEVERADAPSAVFIALGTSRASAGSADKFELIDRQYVLNAAKAAKNDTSPQRLIYCSSNFADKTSSFLYTRSKGLTEEGLASSGYAETIIFRPALLHVADGRDQPRRAETIIHFFTGRLQRLHSGFEIETSVVAKAMVRAGEMGIEQCLQAGIGHTEKLGDQGQEALVIGNGEAIKLANLKL